MKYFLELSEEERAQIAKHFDLAKQVLAGEDLDDQALDYSAQGEIAFFVGEFYKRGQFTEIDEEKAVFFYQKGASLRNREAQNRLGEAYRFGEGITQNDALAVEWWCKASFQRCREAALSLDRLESRTENPGQLEEKGWWRRAVFSGDVEAKLIYGNACFFGSEAYEIPKNEEMAIAWWEKAANQGSARALYRLGDAWMRGRGVPKDTAKAQEFYQLSASLNDPLGKDKCEAFEWQFRVKKRGGGD
ncbi:sel1 repeat family protein [Acetobacteraceae bacterium]|nr:sel1 repeat family protein [Acetobacteraceae bacterium]